MSPPIFAISFNISVLEEYLSREAGEPMQGRQGKIIMKTQTWSGHVYDYEKRISAHSLQQIWVE